MVELKDIPVVMQLMLELMQALFLAPCCIHFKTYALFVELNSEAGAGGILSSPFSFKHLYRSLELGDFKLTSRMMFV
jgi:hypothetical protein